MGQPIKRIDIAEFRREGYLQEANRQFFHPLGLALEIIVDEEGGETLGGVWDFRDDSEGLMFAGADMGEEFLDRVANVEELRLEKRGSRIKLMGERVQPVDFTDL